MSSGPVNQLAPPDGFQQHASGLIIPAAAAPALEREDWTEQDAKILARAEKVLRRRGLAVILACQDNRCAETPLISRRDIPGGYTYVCRHKERVILSGR